MENNTQDITPPKKSKTILGRLGNASQSGIKAIIKHPKAAIRIALATLALLAGGYAYKQLKRSPEQVKKDAERIREEETPKKYKNPVRSGFAKFGSKVGEWYLTKGKEKQ